jgi:hypothetical protein
VGIADAVQNEQRLSAPGPTTGFRKIERPYGLRLGYRDNAAMQHGAGDARQLFVFDHAVGTADPRHIGTELAYKRHHAFLIEKPQNPVWIASEQGSHGGQSGDSNRSLRRVGDRFLCL